VNQRERKRNRSPKIAEYPPSLSLRKSSLSGGKRGDLERGGLWGIGVKEKNSGSASDQTREDRKKKAKTSWEREWRRAARLTPDRGEIRKGRAETPGSWNFTIKTVRGRGRDAAKHTVVG